MKSNKFNVEGIHCGSCVAKIENGLNSLEGLKSVSVNIESGEVLTEVEEGTSPMAIKSCIEDLGYVVSGFSKA